MQRYIVNAYLKEYCDMNSNNFWRKCRPFSKITPYFILKMSMTFATNVLPRVHLMVKTDQGPACEPDPGATYKFTHQWIVNGVKRLNMVYH